MSQYNRCQPLSILVVISNIILNITVVEHCLKAKTAESKNQNLERHLERHLFEGDGVLVLGYSLCIVSVLDNITKISIQVSACFPFSTLSTWPPILLFHVHGVISWDTRGTLSSCSWYNFQMTIRHTHSTELTLSQNQMGSGHHSLSL